MGEKGVQIATAVPQAAVVYNQAAHYDRPLGGLNDAKVVGKSKVSIHPQRLELT